MTLTATYLSDLSRVRVEFSSAPAGADYALIERSTDGVNWTTLRGGATVPISGGAGKIDDYYFAAGKLNTYRASYVDSADISWIGSSGPFSGNNASLAVAYNGSTATGDLILIYATIRNTAATVNTPAGWTRLVDMGNAVLFGKYQDGAAAPTVTFSGGAAGDDTTAQCTTYRNAELLPVTLNTQSNASAQNIAVPALSPPVAPTVVVALGWKQDDWSSAPTITGFVNELGQVPATAGNDSGHVWWTKPRTTTTPEGTNVFVVTGGGAAISKAAMAAFAKRAYLQRDTQTITPTPLGIWFKSITRPSLNQQVTVTDFSDIARGSRSAFFEVVNRTMPIANTDLMGSQRLTLVCTTPDKGEELKLDNMLAAGDVFFIQAPSDACPIPTMYAVIDGDMARSKHSKRTSRRYFDIPVREVAAPSNLITGDTVLWSDIIATYATWQDLLNAKATWSDVIDSIATSVVIVP